MVIAVIAVSLLGEGRGAFADGGVQFWQTTIASFDLHPDWAITLEEQFKVGHDVGNLYYHHADLGVVYKSLAKGMDVGFNYKQVYQKDDDGDWTQENRPHLNAIFRGRLGTFDFFDRSRLEYRDREDDRDIWRYTHLLKVTLPFELTKFKLRPFVADQVYINLNGHAFDKNRIYSGLSLELSKNVKSEFCYIWQTAKSDGRWDELNALGLLLRIRF